MFISDLVTLPLQKDWPQACVVVVPEYITHLPPGSSQVASSQMHTERCYFPSVESWKITLSLSFYADGSFVNFVVWQPLDSL